MSNLRSRALLELGLYHVRGCVFIDDDGHKRILLRDGLCVMRLEQCGLALSKRFSFYDQVHTTGMDIPQPQAACAALTLSKDMTFRDFAQGAYRMRAVGVGQRIELLVIPEVQRLIDDAVGTAAGVSRRAPVSGGASPPRAGVITSASGTASPAARLPAAARARRGGGGRGLPARLRAAAAARERAVARERLLVPRSALALLGEPPEKRAAAAGPVAPPQLDQAREGAVPPALRADPANVRKAVPLAAERRDLLGVRDRLPDLEAQRAVPAGEGPRGAREAAEPYRRLPEEGFARGDRERAGPLMRARAAARCSAASRAPRGSRRGRSSPSAADRGARGRLP